MYITQKQFQRDVFLLADIIKSMGVEYDWIICVTWWGLHLTYYLSKLLGIKNIQNINVSSYEWKKNKRIKNYTEWIMINCRFNKYLVVDDLVDTWKTIRYIRKKFWTNTDVATLYHKNKCPKPAYYVKEISPKERITFYYEHNIDE